MSNETLTSLSATALAAMIRGRRVSPVEVLAAHMARLERLNPRLNALVGVRREQALAEARDAEARVMRGGDLPPFLGVPCTIKESIEVEGMSHTVGSTRRRAVVGKQDAPVVARMRRAGFVPIGVSNVPEGCFWFETDNLIYGRTLNPYDRRRGAGGSSGGEGAALGAGMAPVGLGSDIAGSIRLPSFFCGVFGLKPTQGRVPFTRHWPFYPGGKANERDQYSMVTIGPMARRAEDLIPVLAAIEGVDGVDGHTERTGRLPLGDPRTVAWKGKKVFVLADPRVRRVSRTTPELRQATERAARHFASLGATVVPVDERIFDAAVKIWSATIETLDLPTLQELIAEGKPSTPLHELLGLVTGRATHSFPVLQVCVGERLLPFVRGKAEAVREGRRLRERLTGMLGRDNIFLMPPHPRPAPRHRLPLLVPFDYALTGIWNVLNCPVAAAPMGLGSEGVPIGVQIAAGHGADHVAAAAAMTIEAAFGGWVAPA